MLCRGIGFAIARQLSLKLAEGDLYLTTRGDTESLNTMLRSSTGAYQSPVEVVVPVEVDVDENTEVEVKAKSIT